MLLRAACDACHRMKRKCDGKHPCTRCERRSRDCFYSYKQKSGPPKGSKRKLIEDEDDLPENRPLKPTLVRHADTVGSWTPGGRSGSNGNPNSNPNSNEVAEGRVGDDYGNHNPSSSSALIEAAQQYSQVGAQQFSQAPTQQSVPAPAQHSVPVSAHGFGQVSSPLVGPSPEARAAAAAAVAASRMNALAPAPPPLTAAGLRPSYMLQPPPALPGLSGGSGVTGGGVPAAAPMVTHQQYGTVYQHQYPPEVYAVYLAELRQRSSGHSSSSNSNTSASYSSPATAAATPAPPPAAVGHPWEDTSPLAAPAESTHNRNPAEGGSARTDASEAARSPQPPVGTSGGPLLPGIGGGWFMAGGGASTSSGRDGDSEGGSVGGGGVEPDTVALAHVAQMPGEGGGQGNGSEFSGKAGTAAASSEALAEAVAAAIAESSPRDGDAAIETTNALTYSAVPLDGDRSNGDASGGGGALDPKPPLSPVKSNHLVGFMVPRVDGGGSGVAASPKAAVATTQGAVTASAPAVTSIQREKTELAAAGLLLYGARGQGGGSSNAGVDNRNKAREGGQENLQSEKTTPEV